MDLSQYLETMKNLPERFSNLNFWRGVRKLRDKMVDTFEYVGEWGNGIEGQIANIKGDIVTLNNTDNSLDSRISALENGGGGGGSVEDEIAVIKSDITTLENADKSLDSRIKSLESSDVNLNTEITDIKSGITTLENTDTSLDSRISALESSDVNLNTEITGIKNDITALETADTSLDSRISALENAGGGGGGALVFNSNHKTFNPQSIEVLESNLDTSESGSLLVPYPKVIYARFSGTLSDLEANSLIVNALMTGSFAVSNGQQYSTTVQLHDEPMYAVRVNDTSYKLYTAWIPFSVKTKDSFRVTMPNLTVYYTTAVM